MFDIGHGEGWLLLGVVAVIALGAGASAGLSAFDPAFAFPRENLDFAA